MAYVKDGRVRIYWEGEGSGEPLLLIMGLSFSLAMWGELRPFLARRFRTILFDNRGVGKSSVPLRPFSIEMMADDARRVLDAAEVESAHVIGISMGGMIAQELALRHPRRVRTLILGCTFCGRRHSVLPERAVNRVLTTPFMTRKARLEAMVPILYDPGTPAERIRDDIELVKRHAPVMLGYLQQLRAIYRWDSYDRLPRIACPTHIIHGESDRLIPAENGRILAARIPGTSLTIIPRAGHIFPTDQPEISRARLLECLGVEVQS